MNFDSSNYLLPVQYVLDYAEEHGITLDYFEIRSVKCQGVNCLDCHKESTTVCPECGSNRKGKLGRKYGEIVECECGALLVVCTTRLNDIMNTRPEDLIITGYISSIYTKMAVKDDII